MKQKKIFTCTKCAAQSPRWLGRCPDCGDWNSYVEETFTQAAASEAANAAKGLGAFKAKLIEDTSSSTPETQAQPQKIGDIKAEFTQRLTTGYAEFDRVLGGGIVPGSLVLIGGDPGIGKSTILMQGLAGLKQRILYVSGEESAHQIKLRAERLGVKDDEFYILAENNLEAIIDAVMKLKPRLLVVDSIQTLFTNLVTSAPGSVSQIRECCGKLMMLAKTLGVATFIVGHITKDGSIAGPKVLEHMVDTVLYFESSVAHVYRLLRAVKNRFGSTNEIGVFEMVEGGLREVANPSELFLQERPMNATGSVVVSAIEGSRPILVEVQALVSASNLGMPRRTTLGVDSNKVALLVAVIEKKLGIPLYGHDIFVNVAGGIELDEPSVDLGIALAMISSFKNVPLDPKLLVCGEVGLTGEVRNIAQLDLRLAEAKKLGLSSALVPKTSLAKLDAAAKKSVKGLDLMGVSTLAQAVQSAFGEEILSKPIQPVGPRYERYNDRHSTQS